jgi:hypothetical protein
MRQAGMEAAGQPIMPVHASDPAGIAASERIIVNHFNVSQLARFMRRTAGHLSAKDYDQC